jgi:hypothetical protein
MPSQHVSIRYKESHLTILLNVFTKIVCLFEQCTLSVKYKFVNLAQAYLTNFFYLPILTKKCVYVSTELHPDVLPRYFLYR